MVYYTTVQLSNIPVPARLKCWQCQKWKRSQLFSNKQQKEYKVCILQGGNTTSLVVKCIDCASDQRFQLDCKGPCGEAKDLNQFSKTAKKAGGSQWCFECTDWKQGYETNVQVGPAPEATLAPDESHGSTLAIAGLDEEEDFATEDGNSTVPVGYETGKKNPWYKKASEKSEVPTEFDNASEVTGQMGGLRLENEHPHLRGIGYKGPLDKPSSTASGSRNTPSISSTSVSNPYDSEPDEEEWRPVGPRARRQDPVAFNGYDNRGQRHSQQRQPSTRASSQVSSSFQTGPHYASASAVTQAPPALPIRNPGPPPASSEQTTLRYGLEGDDHSDSDDDHYYD